MKAIKQFLTLLSDGILLSFSQIFFCNKKWFGFVLLLITTAYPYKAIVGIASVIISICFGLLFKFNTHFLKTGIYSYNSLLVGIGIASLYQLSLIIIVLIVFYAILSLFLSVWLFHYLQKFKLPFLTIPFLLCIWMVHLSNFAYGSIESNLYSEPIFNLFEPFSNGFSNVVDHSFLADYWHIIFKSISGIFFIHNDLIGFVILFSILIYSRIAFTLSFFGFAIGILFFNLFLGDNKELILNTDGFNFILIAIALGGFFIVPSTKSYVFQLFAISFSCVLMGTLTVIFNHLKLPIYSLPFVLVVLISLLVFYQRTSSKGIDLVQNQQYQPEENLYKFFYDKIRFQAKTYHHVYLPVMGEWNISQGIDGGITHLEHWKNAWDFDVRNFQDNSFNEPGIALKDFLCYDLPVIAPISGYVVNLINTVDENEVGKVNTTFNWGNTVVIKVAEHFFVQLSHLKLNSFKVALGEYVTAGQQLATCGNSGRSPEPHLHFQFQITPDVGSKTILYPISYYLTKNENNSVHFNAFDYPKEKEQVSNIIPNYGMQNAFTFLPNRTITFEITKNSKTYTKDWTINVNGFNQSYFFDSESNSYAYYKNDGVLFYFYDFHGDKNSELFLFYLALQKVLLAPILNCKIKDWIMPSAILSKPTQFLQDFIAPFYQLYKGKYESEIIGLDNEHYPNEIEMTSKITYQFFAKEKEILHSSFSISNQKLDAVTVTKNNLKTNFICQNIVPVF